MLADAPTIQFPNLPPPWSDVPPTYYGKLGAAKASPAETLTAYKNTTYGRLDQLVGKISNPCYRTVDSTNGLPWTKTG